jgi:signal transduction histidine kinase
MKGFLGSMAGRVFLVLLAGIILAVAVTAFLSGLERKRAFAQMNESRVVERVVELVSLLDSVPAGERAGIIGDRRLMRGLFDIRWSSVRGGPQDDALTAALRAQLGESSDVAVIRTPDSECPEFRGRGRDGPRFNGASPGPRVRPECRTISLTLQDGTPLSLVMRTGMLPPPRMKLIRWQSPYLLFFAACVALLAYAVSRMATRPIARLAQAAKSLGEDFDQPPLDESSGPAEVRRAAAAFNAMQSRIRNHLQERTQMLAAISHDLQTPLTRLRLRLEKVSDEALRAKLIEDMTAMQDMVREGLDLARSLDVPEAVRTLDLDALIGSVCADLADAGMDVTAEGKTSEAVRANPTALRRCLTNIIENAVKYGGYARVRAQRQGGRVRVTVRDGGPGIPEGELEKVFEPFYRLEASRSRETGGTGLGLPIARNIAARLGGTLTLRNHPDGGLEAEFQLPVIG